MSSHRPCSAEGDTEPPRSQLTTQGCHLVFLELWLMAELGLRYRAFALRSVPFPRAVLFPEGRVLS